MTTKTILTKEEKKFKDKRNKEVKELINEYKYIDGEVEYLESKMGKIDSELRKLTGKGYYDLTGY